MCSVCECYKGGIVVMDVILRRLLLSVEVCCMFL